LCCSGGSTAGNEGGQRDSAGTLQETTSIDGRFVFRHAPIVTANCLQVNHALATSSLHLTYVMATDLMIVVLRLKVRVEYRQSAGD
jgi:hypothetical protein